jgi:pyruvate formate lyase activating enzyme
MEIKIKELHLLPYHRYGISKYEKLNLPYTFDEKIELEKNRIEVLKEELSGFGFNIKIGG